MSARAAGDSLWLDRNTIGQALDWHWKPEGLCRADICVPIPPGNADKMIDGDRLDVAALWRHIGQPVARDDDSTTWVFGTGAQQRAQTLSTLQAPDFELPDADGKLHRLSDYRGKKVLLVTWASW
jgi:hypothetical protein